MSASAMTPGLMSPDVAPCAMRAVPTTGTSSPYVPRGSDRMWRVALVTSAYGLDFTVAYTDTSIEPSGCGNTSYCSGRMFVSVTKAF